MKVTVGRALDPRSCAGDIPVRRFPYKKRPPTAGLCRYQRMLQPDFKQFSRLSREATLVPVVNSVSADLLTPVSAFLSIAEKEPHAFLLESIERGEQIGRYTFLGARPYMRVKARQGTVEIERGRRREVVRDSVFQVVKRLLREHRPATVPGLPPFTAGAVGY